jgi:glycosyltransferase involved in cell wall biosynthesis
MRPAPRVLHLTRDFPPRCAGGISTAVGGLVAAARQADLPHAVLSFDGWRPTRPAGTAETHPEDDARGVLLRIAGPADLAAAGAAARRFRPDLVHIHHALLFELAAELSPGTPRLFTAHVLQRHLSSLRGLAAPTLSDAAEAVAMREAARVSVPTQAARAQLGDPLAFVTRLAPTKTDILSPFDPANPSTPDNSSAFDTPAPHLLVLSRFDVLKGTDDVLEALPQLLALRDDLTVTVAGGIPENPKAERRWRRRFEALGYPGPRVRILPWLAPAAARGAMSEASHFLAASHAETCGLALMEARSAGLVLIASDLPAHREIAPEAHFFLAGSPASLIEAVHIALRASHRPDAPVPPSWAEVLPDWVHFWRI